jgi:hypothetical protein
MFIDHITGTCHRTGKRLHGIRLNDDCVTATDCDKDAIDTVKRLNGCDLPMIGRFNDGITDITLHVYTSHPMISPYCYFSDLSVGFHIHRNESEEVLYKGAIATYKRKHKITLTGSILWSTWKQNTNV